MPLQLAAGWDPDLRKSPPSFLVFRSVHRFSANVWNPVPDAPIVPAFFLGALSIDLSPLDTFMELKVCSPFLLRFSSSQSGA